MAKYTGVTQNKDGSWSYRIKKKVDGKVIDTKIKKDENGMPFLTARACYEAKIRHEAQITNGEVKIAHRPSKTTLQSIYDAYMVSSEAKQKAPATIRKQESMWKNHVQPAFGDKEIESFKITDLNDFLYDLYGKQGKSYAYTEGFLKFFYSAANALLIYKQQPQATQLKDFRDWQEDGVKVNKGAKSLSILEPVEYTKNDGSTGIAYNVKKVFDVAQTSGKKPAAPTLDRDPRKLVAIMLDTAPIDVSTVEELPSPNMGAFYKNEDQTLYIKRDIGDSVALCQCVAQELGHAQLAMNCEAYSRRDMGFSAVCVGYMLCRKFGVDVKNFAIDRIPEELAGKSPKEIRAELSKTRSAMSEIGSRVSEEIYRRRAERSKEQER